MITLDAALDAARLDHLIRVYRDGLLEDTLPFWLTHGADPDPGGIMTCLDRDGSVLDTDKGVWQQGRFAWMLGRAWHAVERRPEWLEAASHTLRFIEEHGFDDDGRMFFHVTREGRPIRKRRTRSQRRLPPPPSASTRARPRAAARPRWPSGCSVPSTRTCRIPRSGATRGR